MIAPRSLPSALALEDVLRKGREALEAGQVEGALRTFDAAIRIKPTYAPAWRAKARALRTAGNPQAALNCYREALRHEPEDEASWFGLALTFHALGRRADEVLAYEELLRRNPRSTPAWTNKGVALHETGKFAKALACYDRILEMRPELAAAWNNRGAALLRLARPEEALAAFDEALALEHGFADAAANRKTALARLGRDDPMPGSITLPPPIALPALLQTRVLSSLGLASIDAWRRDRPRSADDFVAVGASLLDDGKPEASLAAFRKAEALGAGPLALLGIATALEVLHDSRLAVEAERLLTIEGIPRAAIAAARIREWAGDPAGARAALEAALARDSSLAWIWRWKGILELRAGRPAEACASFERATAADPSDADAWASLAAALHREGRSQEALAACERALTADAASGIALNNQGVILASMGREDEARVALEAAAKCTEEPIVVVNQAMLAEAGDRLRAALALVDDAIASFPEEDGLVAARRRVLGRLGARERASRDRLVARIAAISGLGEATANRIVRAGYDSSAKLRRAREAELREAAGITKAQAHAVCRAFRA